jgi:hypothetical protein
MTSVIKRALGFLRQRPTLLQLRKTFSLVLDKVVLSSLYGKMTNTLSMILGRKRTGKGKTWWVRVGLTTLSEVGANRD